MRKLIKKVKAGINGKGQATVEFLLMMGAVVTLLLTFFTLFHEKLAGVFFYIIGSVLS